MENALTKGIFIEEAKSRFLCTVSIEGRRELCYVSSSSKLSHFINLNGREVLLIKNSGNSNRTKYTLYAVKTEEGYALLNLVYINKLLLNEFKNPESLYSSIGKVYAEKKINDTLKVDFFIEGEENIVVEAKGVLTEDRIAKFPAMKVVRAENQLEKFQQFIELGIGIHYYIILMNNTIESLELDNKYRKFVQLFEECINNGMQVYIYRAIWNENFLIFRDQDLEHTFIESVKNQSREHLY